MAIKTNTSATQPFKPITPSEFNSQPSVPGRPLQFGPPLAYKSGCATCNKGK